MVSPKTAAALVAFRKDAKPSADQETMVMIRADVLRVYGWTWPQELDLVAGAKALFDFLIEKHSKR